MDFIKELNDKQYEAASTPCQNVRIIAGAGSGKTKALTCRYAYLVNVLGVDPANILCLTFTNKAAQEMRQRISKLVASGDYNDFVFVTEARAVIDEKLKKKVRKLLTFELKKSGRNNLPKENLKLISEMIRRSARVLLE